MKTIHSFFIRGFATFVFGGILAPSLSAQTVDFTGDNLALSGASGTPTPIMGTATSLIASGDSFAQNGSFSPLNDGVIPNPGYNTDVFSTTANASPNNTFDYAGVTWGTAQNDVAGFRAYFRGFSDGGGFTSLPQIQSTTDGGTTWSAVINQGFYNPGSGPEDDWDIIGTNTTGIASFTFDAVSGINGIRIIGDGNGTQAGNGFIGLREIEVYAVPEPDTIILVALGLAGLFVTRLRKRR